MKECIKHQLYKISLDDICYKCAVCNVISIMNVNKTGYIEIKDEQK